VTTLIFGF